MSGHMVHKTAKIAYKYPSISRGHGNKPRDASIYDEKIKMEFTE